MSDTANSTSLALPELIGELSDKKWKLLGISAFCFTLGTGLELLSGPAEFRSTTIIRPISEAEGNKYAKLNAPGFVDFAVTPQTLMDDYVNHIQPNFLKSLFEKHELLDRNDFNSIQGYEEALASLALTVEVLPLKAEFTNLADGPNFAWTINFEYNDAEKWSEALFTLHTEITEKVRAYQIEKFETHLEIYEVERTFLIDDLETQIANVKADFNTKIEQHELERNFRLEDIAIQINNAMEDYDRKTIDRLAFLAEQAAIARALGVAKNTIEAQSFNSQTSVLANITTTDTPFYLRGYEAIAKEIELINVRTNKRAFVKDLFKLEQAKRELLQDKKAVRAELQKNYLQEYLELSGKRREARQDKTKERLEQLFNGTPIENIETFVATTLAIETTRVEYTRRRFIVPILTLILGFIVGVSYIVFHKHLALHKTTNENTV